MDRKVSVSLCMICGGGRAEYLRQCLKSIHEYVDEINITMTKPCKASEDVAKEYKANISTFKWNDSFADARNYNFKQATKDVILWLDDDDIVVGGEKFVKTIDDAFEHPEVSTLFVMYNYERAETGMLVTRHWRDRIVRRGCFEWVAHLHEAMKPLGNREIMDIKTEDFLVEHTEAQVNSRAKHIRNLRILYKMLREEGADPDPRTLVGIGKTLFGLDCLKTARKFYNRYMAVSGWDAEKYHTLLNLSKLDQREGKWDDALNKLLEMLKLKPKMKAAYFEMAEIYSVLHDWEKVIYWTEEGFKHSETMINDLVSENPRAYDYNALLILAEALLQSGKASEAMEAYSQILKFQPDNRLFKKLFNTCKQLDEISQTGDRLVRATEFCLQNEQILKAEQIINSAPLEVRDIPGVRRQRARVKKIMDRIRDYSKGKREMVVGVNLKSEPTLKNEAKYQTLLEALKPVPGAKILDVGCYNGWMTRALAKEGYKVTGCDIGTEALDHARKLSKGLKPQPRFVKCEVHDVGKEFYQKFDVVTCFDVFEHMIDPKRLLENLEQACMPNGWIILHLPDGAWHRGHMDFQNEKLWEHVNSYDYSDMMQILAGRHGLRVLKCKYDSVESPGQGSMFIMYQNKQNTGSLVEIFCTLTAEEWSPKSIKTGIGGSEEAVINMAQELFKLGHRVIVYNACGAAEGVYNNIPYVDTNCFDQFAEHDILIAWRNPQFFRHPMNARRKYVWMHDVPNLDFFDKDTLENIDKIFVLSKFHRSLFTDIPDDKFYITRNGVDLSLFKQGGNVNRDPYKVVYASSPDRGLDKLLIMWPDIKKAVPEAHLHIYYGWSVFDLFHRKPKELAWKKWIMSMTKQDGVTWHGRVGQPELAVEFQSAGVWAYPTYFEEISCITAMKAQVAGCIPVCTDYAALADTVAYGYKVKGRMDNDKTFDEFKHVFIQVLQSQPNNVKMIDHASRTYSWSSVAKEWSNYFPTNLKAGQQAFGRV